MYEKMKEKYGFLEWKKNYIAVKLNEKEDITFHIKKVGNLEKVEDDVTFKPILCSCDGETQFRNNGSEIYCPKCRKTYPIVWDYEYYLQYKKEKEEEYRKWCQEEIAKFEAEK